MNRPLAIVKVSRKEKRGHSYPVPYLNQNSPRPRAASPGHFSRAKSFSGPLIPPVSADLFRHLTVHFFWTCLTALESQALTLPLSQRAALARLLLESLDAAPDTDPNLEAAIADQVHRRYLAHLANPNTPTHTHEAVVAEITNGLPPATPHNG